MIRLLPIRLLLVTMAAVIAAPATYASSRPRDTSVACARADNQYCRDADARRGDDVSFVGVIEPGEDN